MKVDSPSHLPMTWRMQQRKQWQVWPENNTLKVILMENLCFTRCHSCCCSEDEWSSFSQAEIRLGGFNWRYLANPGHSLQVGLQKFCSYNLQKFVYLCLILVILLVTTVISNTSLPKVLFCLSFPNCH